jgi:hypothetical protein
MFLCWIWLMQFDLCWLPHLKLCGTIHFGQRERSLDKSAWIIVRYLSCTNAMKYNVVEGFHGGHGSWKPPLKQPQSRRNSNSWSQLPINSAIQVPGSQLKLLATPDDSATMTEQLIFKGTLERHSGWVTTFATPHEKPYARRCNSPLFAKPSVVW